MKIYFLDTLYFLLEGILKLSLTKKKADIFHSLQPSTRKIKPQVILDSIKIEHNFTSAKLI